MLNLTFKIIITTTLLLLTSCTDNSNITQIDNPNEVTIAFFHALYNERDIDKAASVCSPPIAKLLRHYRSVPSIGKYMFNMMYDTVDIKPDDAGVKLREQFKNKAEITVYFDGYYNDDRIKDVKRILLIQEGNRWIINKILKDPF